MKPGAIAIILILIASLRIVSTYRALSHTTDEPAHIAAGIEWIENGTYTYEDQHPPLARVIAALGIHFAGSRWSRNKDMYFEGFHLLGENRRYNRALFFSRLFMLPFFWIGAAAVCFWGLKIAGARAAVLATLIFTTTPPILAHAGLATTDMAITAFVSAALAASLYWVSEPGWRTSAILGLTLGLALLSKFSSLAFLPAAWLLMYIANFTLAIRRIVKLLPWAALALAIALLLIWPAYHFTVGPVAFLDHTTLPAPAFFTGIHYVWGHNNVGHLSYLLGHLSQHGFWYYYPVVLSVKTPIATLILLVIAICQRNRRQIATPLALIAALLAIGFFSHINIGVRHILPIYTGFALCAGIALDRMLRANRKWLTWTAATLIVWQIGTGIIEHPDYLSYTNELAGSHPERILADSDLDWDQGMRGLAIRLQELGVQHLYFKLNSSGYMIANGHTFPPYELMPDGDDPPPGWNAVCITGWKLAGQPKWAERIEPTEKIHRSIYLYYIPSNGQQQRK